MASKKELARQRIAAKKRRKRAARICCYLVAAILINWVFCALMADTRSATAENTAQTTVTIDNTYYHKPISRHGSTKFWITADSVRYHFNFSAQWYSARQTEIGSVLDLQKGDQITLVYRADTKDEDRYIVAAYDDSHVYCTLEGYNKSEMDSRIATLCVYFFVTGVYSFVMVCCEGWFMQWIRAGSKQRKLEAEQRHKANIAANKAAKAKKE